MSVERPANAVLMSIHKSGTNLVGRLIEALGYNMIGPGFQPSYTPLDARWVERGRPFRSWAPSPDGLINFILSEYPIGTCACAHRLSARSNRTASILNRRIPIIFNYRDPRDVMISEIYYVMNSPPPFPRRQRESRTFKSMSSMSQRIEYFLDAEPDYFTINFRCHEWLLEAPGVLCVSYEELVGSRGGGDADVQLRATKRLMSYLSVSAKGSAHIARTLYSSKARTFRQGRIGSWRQEFSSHLKRRFNALHRDILHTYGYPER